MGKSEIMLLIVSVVIGIALMAGVVIPIMQDGKDMVEVKNISQEIGAVKDRMAFKRILDSKQINDEVIVVSGTNFLEASGNATYPHKAKNTGALFTNLTFNIDGDGNKTATFDINLAGTGADEVDLVGSESMKKICDATNGVTKVDSILTCTFKVD